MCVTARLNVWRRRLAKARSRCSSPTSTWRDSNGRRSGRIMSVDDKRVVIQSVPLSDIAGALTRTLPFLEVDLKNLPRIERADRIAAPAGAVLVEPGTPWDSYWVLLEGEVRAERSEPDGTWTLIASVTAGEAFGEAPLLTGRSHSIFRVTAL